ncbi:MAG: OB-fold protein [Fimbriimonas sp.]
MSQTFLQWYEELDKELNHRGLRGSDFAEDDLRREYKGGASPAGLAQHLAPLVPVNEPAPSGSSVKPTSTMVVVLVCLAIIGAIWGTISIATSRSPSTVRGSSTRMPVLVTAGGVVRAYEENEVAANQSFRGQRWRVQGMVAEVGHDLADSPYVILSPNDGTQGKVQFTFDSSDQASLAVLRKGEVVTIEGSCEGRPLGQILFADSKLQ